MSLKRTDLVYDLFYSSSTETSTSDRIVVLTAQFRLPSGANQLTTQLTRRIVKSTKAKQYQVGQQIIADGSDPLLVAAETFYRQDPATTIEELMGTVQDFIEGNLGANSTWMGVYGIKILSGEDISLALPDSVLNADGQATATTAAATSGTTSGQ